MKLRKRWISEDFRIRSTSRMILTISLRSPGVSRLDKESSDEIPALATGTRIHLRCKIMLNSLSQLIMLFCSTKDALSPTPIFGECKKTCDLQAMFANHQVTTYNLSIHPSLLMSRFRCMKPHNLSRSCQPKRRRYDKRTSSADWGDDRASFMVCPIYILALLCMYTSAL